MVGQGSSWLNHPLLQNPLVKCLNTRNCPIWLCNWNPFAHVYPKWCPHLPPSRISRNLNLRIKEAYLPWLSSCKSESTLMISLAEIKSVNRHQARIKLAFRSKLPVPRFAQLAVWDIHHFQKKPQTVNFLSTSFFCVGKPWGVATECPLFLGCKRTSIGKSTLPRKMYKWWPLYPASGLTAWRLEARSWTWPIPSYYQLDGSNFQTLDSPQVWLCFEAHVETEEEKGKVRQGPFDVDNSFLMVIFKNP